MPFCPQCRDEYREGFTVCADCGEPLVASLPEEPEAPAEGAGGSHGGWEEVGRGRLYEAELMALRLREAGLEARVLDQSRDPLRGLPAMTDARVLVPVDQAAEAGNVLAEPATVPEDGESEALPEEAQTGPGEGRPVGRVPGRVLGAAIGSAVEEALESDGSGDDSEASGDD